MSVVFSGNFSGTFVSDGLDKLIPLPSGADFMRVQNRTVSYAAGGGGGAGAEFFWTRDMTPGRGTIYTKLATGMLPAQIAAGSGFFYIDTSNIAVGASVALTAIDNGTPPVVSTANTAGLIADSSIVRIYNTAGVLQFGGMEFTVGAIVANTSFELAFGPTIVAGTNGTFRIVAATPFVYWYPQIRYITGITRPQDQQVPNTIPGVTIVTMSVTHTYTIGQKVRLKIPTVTALAFGTTELNNVEATIIDINDVDSNGFTNTITLDIDSSLMSAFAYPLTTDPAFTPAQVIPIGEQTSKALLLGQNILGDSTENRAQIGMLLKGGATGPAGVEDDIIDWQAFKSFNR